jgi:hypothetical protein
MGFGSHDSSVSIVILIKPGRTGVAAYSRKVHSHSVQTGFDTLSCSVSSAGCPGGVELDTHQ